MQKIKIVNEIWRYEGPSAWLFVTVPQDVSSLIKELYSDLSPGFGTIRVQAKVGRTIWETSIFYDKKFEAYLLPIKSDVRMKEKLATGEIVEIEVEVKL